MPRVDFFAIASALVTTLTVAYTPPFNSPQCTADQQQSVNSVFNAIATSSACSPFASKNQDTGITTINWLCSDVGCVNVLKQMTPRMPYCYNSASFVNSRFEFEWGLYVTCKLCATEDLTKLDDLWSSAASSTACRPYATVKSTATSTTTSFKWPCTATDCTDVLDKMSYSMPDCRLPGKEIEKEQVQEAVRDCRLATTAPPTPKTTTPPATSAPSGGAGSSVVRSAASNQNGAGILIVAGATLMAAATSQ